MSLGIPLPGSFGDALGKGLDTGSSLFQRMMAPKIQQAQLQQQWQQHLENLAIKKQQEQRLGEQAAREAELHPWEKIFRENRANNESKKYNPEKQKLELDKIRAQIKHEEAKTKKAQTGENPEKIVRQRQLINSQTWSSMPASSKEHLVALGNQLGIRPDELVQGMTSGKKFEDIAAEHGYDRDEVSKVIPKYLATTGNVTAENERQKNLAELSVLEDHVTEAMAPYIETIGGYSIKQIVDSFKGKDPDKLAKYLAARSFQPEIMALRIKAAGGNVGQGAIEELLHSALGQSRILQSQVTPEVYKKMNHYIKEWLSAGSKAATHSVYGRGESKPESGEKPKKRFNMATGMVE